MSLTMASGRDLGYWGGSGGEADPAGGLGVGGWLVLVTVAGGGCGRRKRSW